MMAKVISNSLSSFSHSGFQKYCATTSQQTRQILKLDFSLTSIKHRENNQNQIVETSASNKIARSIDLVSSCSSLDSEMDTDDLNSKSGHHLIDDDDDDDEKSRCSEDSELSVGQEDLCDNDEIIINTNNHVKSTISLNNKLVNNKKIDKLSVTSSCNSANVNIHNEIVDDVEDEISNQSSSQCTVTSSTLCSPKENFKINCDNVIRVPVMRPSPTRFHEEFLRSSQLYAEELMRQQMSIVAAARGIQMSTKLNTDPTSVVLQNPIANPLAVMPTARLANNETNNSTNSVDIPLTIMSFRPHLRNQSDQENNNNLPVRTEHLNFRNLHSHLNAISQITNNLTSDIRKITSPSLSSITSRESSQSPPNYQLHPQNFFNHHQNQINEQNLKFSIDNILKADFGRRITEPLMKSAKNKRLHHREHKSTRDINKKHITSSVTPIDLTSNIPSATPPVSTPTPPCQAPASESGSSGSSTVWPAWVYCTRYSDRPSSGRSPRTKRPKKPPSEKVDNNIPEDKRPRTAFSGPQLARLKHEFNENRYLTERRRQQLSAELGLNEAQIKIWFQNKRAKIKKSTGQKNPLALQLMAQGLYNHSTVPLTQEEEELQEMQAAGNA